ncbi:hypothetical protein [Pararhizobium sp. A13]
MATEIWPLWDSLVIALVGVQGLIAAVPGTPIAVYFDDSVTNLKII